MELLHVADDLRHVGVLGSECLARVGPPVLHGAAVERVRECGVLGPKGACHHGRGFFRIADVLRAVLCVAESHDVVA